MESVGICGSDVHYLIQGKIGKFVVKKPMVIGHEGSGTVLRIGDDVKNLKIGNRVAIEPGVPCRLCKNCKEGRYHLCPEMRFCATPPVDGNLQRFFVHDSDFCFKLPDTMNFDEGAAVEPLACACRACRRGNVRIGSKILVMGCGPVGLMVLMAAKAMGTDKAIVTDIKDYRLEKAKTLGADCAFNHSKMNEDQIMKCIIDSLGEKPSITFDCSGAEQCIRLGMLVTQMGGKFIIVGLGADEMKLPFMAAALNEVDMKGVFRYVNEYPIAIELIRSKKVRVKEIITHHFKIEESVQAFELAKSGNENPIKIIIHPNQKWKPYSSEKLSFTKSTLFKC